MTASTINNRDWEITVNGEPVTHLFDGEGSETLDPTEASEAMDASGFMAIEVGDVIAFKVVADRGWHDR